MVWYIMILALSLTENWCYPSLSRFSLSELIIFPPTLFQKGEGHIKEYNAHIYLEI